MLLVWKINEKLPLHTFLPSATEVLPLPLPVSVISVVTAAFSTLQSVSMTHDVNFLTRVYVDVTFLL